MADGSDIVERLKARGHEASERAKLSAYNEEMYQRYFAEMRDCEEAADLIERLRAQAPGWRTMESAPKDGTAVELRGVMLAHFIQGGGQVSDDASELASRNASDRMASHGLAAGARTHGGRSLPKLRERRSREPVQIPL